MKQRIKEVLLLVLIGILFLGVGCAKKEEAATIDQVEAPKEREVIEAFGIIKAKDIQNIVIDFPSSVEKVHVQEGQHIQQGDILVSLDIKDHLGEVKSKAHKVNILQLEKNKIENTLIDDGKSDPAIMKATNGLKLAEELYNQGKKDLASQEALLKAGAIAQGEYDKFKATVDTLYKEMEDARYDLENVQKNKKNERDDLKIKNEELASASYELQMMEEKVKRSYLEGNTIIANVESGVVYDIGYQGGDLVSPEKKVLSILDLNTMVVEAEVSEEFIKDVNMGVAVEIIPIANRDRSYKGKVSRIAQRAIQKNGETIIPVEISIDNNDGFLMPNFNVDVMIQMK
ncbi:MAG: secretion protein HlyD family [Anaerosolibacter sp.]|jgi:multidrug resistance efflux pump|uniref:HlyD family secretion protein n=1 Tax=Anaerosolibacter sp. TaxID=1872527 RepID=UPI00261D3474|nr:efflux RND transporter periplasmic adaptor subunit [Anaerosolibacter sp.]MDF2548018.1 secretion protein HlyD family [Anaerosolibacter sp.]